MKSAFTITDATGATLEARTAGSAGYILEDAVWRMLEGRGLRDTVAGRKVAWRAWETRRDVSKAGAKGCPKSARWTFDVSGASVVMVRN